MDLASEQSWRRLHDHHSVKPEELQTFLPIVEGRPFLERQPDGSVKHGASIGSDGIAINTDGTRLYYCPLGSRKLYSVDTNALSDQSLKEQEVGATVIDEGDRGGASDGLESDSAGNITPLTMSIMRFCAEVQTKGGKRLRTTHDSYGLTYSHWRLTGIFM